MLSLADRLDNDLALHSNIAVLKVLFLWINVNAVHLHVWGLHCIFDIALVNSINDHECCLGTTACSFAQYSVPEQFYCLVCSLSGCLSLHSDSDWHLHQS